jgi:hypothetical protein
MCMRRKSGGLRRRGSAVDTANEKKQWYPVPITERMASVENTWSNFSYKKTTLLFLRLNRQNAFCMVLYRWPRTLSLRLHTCKDSNNNWFVKMPPTSLTKHNWIISHQAHTARLTFPTYRCTKIYRWEIRLLTEPQPSQCPPDRQWDISTTASFRTE